MPHVAQPEWALLNIQVHQIIVMIFCRKKEMCASKHFQVAEESHETCYGAATSSRLLKIIGLFCRI